MSTRTFQAPRGTTDLLPDDQPYWRFVEGVATRAAETFGYDRIDTPTFEDAALFVRGVGEATDIVEKETYTFEDRGGDLLSLRPEGTAPVCRAYLEHGMHNRSQPVRLHYICPMYRYDRPQAGRYRELHQFGAEAIGDGDPAVDAEIIELGWSLLKDAGLTDLTLLLNSIGDPACRPGYIDALRAYFESQDGWCTRTAGAVSSRTPSGCSTARKSRASPPSPPRPAASTTSAPTAPATGAPSSDGSTGSASPTGWTAASPAASTTTPGPSSR